jgi:DNA-directed RNA polymerase beta' subunit
MKIDIANIEEIIKINDLPVVTNSISLNPDRSPTDEGLFSYIKFGKPGSYDRKTIFGYIDLKKPFFHPAIYKMLVSIQRNLLYCIDGSENFIIRPNGELVKDPNGESGINFLYKNWEKIQFKRISSGDEENELRIEKLDLLKKLKKSEVFLTKWLVIPAFYRDLDWTKIQEGKIIKDEINDLYIRLINLSNELDSSESLFFYSNIKDNLIQNTIIEIYEYLGQYLYKKEGMIKKNLLGKAVDYTCRSVISANRYTAPTYNEMLIDFKHVGVPLAELCSLFYPFLVYEITTVIESFIENSQTIPQVTGVPTSELLPANIKIHPNAYMEFLSDKLKKQIDKFIKDPESRTLPIQIMGTDGKFYNLPYLRHFFPDRPLYWHDLIYFLMDRIIQDKHVMVSRYPIDTFQNIFFGKIAILTTVETESRVIGEKLFKFYPKLDAARIEYIDTVRFSNVYLKRIGGDFDGDTVALRSIYTKEANAEADKIIQKKSNLLSGTGTNILNLDKEAALALYYFTKE